MQEQPSKREESDPPVADHIEELARRLREAEHLDPEARAEAADLLGNLAVALNQPDRRPRRSTWPSAPCNWPRP